MNAVAQSSDQRQLVTPSLYSASADALNAFLEGWFAPSPASGRATAVRQRVQATAGAAATEPPDDQPVRIEGQGTRLEMPQEGGAGAKQERNRKSH